MVTRKPVPASATSNLNANAAPPYPVTPLTANPPASFRVEDVKGQLRSSESETSSLDGWAEEGQNKHNADQKPALPDSLRVGPQGFTPNSSQERLRVAGETNPFLKKNNTGSTVEKESSAEAWGDRTGTPPNRPPIPQTLPPEELEKLSISEPSTNPWQPALNEASTTSRLQVQRTGSGDEIWLAPEGPPPGHVSSRPVMQNADSGDGVWLAPEGPPPGHSPAAPISTQKPILIDIEEPESPAWDEDEASPVIHEMPAENIKETQQMNEDRHAWDDNTGHPLHQNPVQQSQPTKQEPWNLVDHEPVGEQQTGVVAGPSTEEQAPALPPRRSQEQPPAQPPRPVIDTDVNTSSTSVTSPGSTARKQKKETYEIKKITWHDVSAAHNPRVSPILVQNANGPCPLLSLVNALTLSTPAGVETALVETLRSREQVSLGLLLDAVFDELMSGRRGEAAQELPDVSDLYSFLITLHTGMNVNPRFFPLPPTRSPKDPRNSMSHVHPSVREATLPGSFEETREMKLYSTFSIPLIHGWLPEQDSPAYHALKRSATSYEDAQNLMFREEELEEKLTREGLSFEEQGTLEDIATIKAFFASHATQLTRHGLDTITQSLAPGSVAILFRNDHFSTLYRHPDTLQLLQLVTDMGYAGHAEVVWESLIDVNGENAEFFSGDFRLVGGAPATPSAAPGDGWTTIPTRRSQNHVPTASTSSQHDPPPPQSPSTEQEDHDLALALQLQEEEEERHRNEIARRQRETELSQQYIEQQGHNTSVPVSQRGGRGRGDGPVRGSGRGRVPPATRSNNTPEVRPMVPPRRPGAGGRPVDPEAGVDAPPPSYEQAAGQAAYVPPEDHPAHPNASPNGQTPGRRMSAYATNSTNIQGTPTGRTGRRGTGPTLIEQIPTGRRNTATAQQNGEGGSGRERDCVVM